MENGNLILENEVEKMTKLVCRFSDVLYDSADVLKSANPRGFYYGEAHKLNKDMMMGMLSKSDTMEDKMGVLNLFLFGNILELIKNNSLFEKELHGGFEIGEK